jgi:hypothetical protein
MGYSNYKKLKQVVDKFGITTQRSQLFAQITPIEPSEWLKQSMNIANAVMLTNEKVKSERLISPILSEVHLLHKHKLSLFSGEELNVDVANDLNGPCDFFFSANPNSYLLTAPIVAFAEAKDENIDYGIAQCTAQMIGAQLFNQLSEKTTPTIWGCSTTGGEWRFLKLTDKILYVDEQSYYIDKVDVLLGIFHQIIEQL